jgi:hypothetical protein
MAYNLIKFNFVKKTQTSVQIDSNVKSFCCVDDDIYFLHDNGIGLINDNGTDLNWCKKLVYVSATDLSNLSSITYNKTDGCLYVVSDGGCQIIKIDIQMLEFDLVISQSSAERFKKKVFSTDQSKTYIVANGHDVAWSVKDCHRCFKMSRGKSVPLVGCGRSGFSLSSPCHARICCPTGILIMEDTICFADSGNNCLRGVKKDSIFNIIDDCSTLLDIHYHNKKLFFLSDNSIHMLSSEGDATHLFEVYRVEQKIQSFCPTGKDCVYILEKNDGGIFKEAESGESS